MKTVSKSPKSESNVVCGICRNPIRDPAHAYQSQFLLIPACSICRAHFSEDDLEMMLNMFLAYGGYFGKKPKENFSFNTLISHIDQIDAKQGNMVEIINIRIMHTALIHGIRPQEYLDYLEKLIK
ncbi:MAG: hypothetical protein GF311_14505 [Candidatus Lokiarchaeota archaeon]|nr:hypothetical protein [Candidatus Lokiarchaeota archaeon]